MKVSFTSKYNGKKLKRLTELYGKSTVRVGILEGTGVHPRSNTTLAAIAWFNEFGTSIRFGRSGGERIIIPERPFLRTTIRENDYYRKEIAYAMKHGLKYGSANTLFHALGVKVVADIQETITSNSFEANAPATIKRKGSDRPLMDTGALRQAIQYELVRGDI